MDLDSMHVFMAQMAALFQGANATNINAFGRYNQLPKKLTPEIRAELIRTGACFRCRQPGHRSKDCRVSFPNTGPRRSLNNTGTPANSNNTNEESGNAQGEN
ncbi:hypothetical protein EMPS_09827 [Entomortierella parvispora]|uniref:CCHC-type domain-containing protein n=1 Tax=Entomortierella parvispora TaxID=205924 RepID=A0A9P3M0P0_9FUNG|nr:hypothetical protein EMPS_09827 [Entomortierella parvispora]